MQFKITRNEIIEIAKSYIGLPFVHQGRSKDTGVDCVGLLVCLGQEMGYPDLKDAEAYRRIPSANVIRSILGQNCDEISVEEAKEGDIYLMRLGGIKPRHAAILYYDDRYDGEPCLIHATKRGVRIEAKRAYPDHWFVGAYRVRGIIE
jgi:cell wall-associated NlpC family hydrolase